ncbi:peptidylprolyl isomerase [Cognaticolwellia beringensis]|uniref:peptidylprolyl isomerase n=1 Tax=Cognaticolwellia beringensis TaxID=1967665 RepID=A0A222GAF2_9GAMM|nr:peptidylprolyl isomerase [Cognaticolwellia beringensis]ASP48865.1 hypothetical protein B5D82_14475 [Cognaticolwellia beringensis]
MNRTSARASHTLDKSEKLAQELGTNVSKSAVLIKLVNKNANHPSGKKSVDLGKFKLGQMVKAFDNVVFKKALLTVNGPIKTKFG